MADFESCFPFVLKHEDSHPSGKVTVDDGGRTRFGIAERAHPHIGDEFYLGPHDASLAIAKEHYRTEYWNPILGDQISDNDVAAKVFDMAVNMGIVEAVVLLQRALRQFGSAYDKPLAVDGHFGPGTLAVLNAAPPSKVLEQLRLFSRSFYRVLATRKPELSKYLSGWLARASA